MDWLTFISSMTSALAWPIAIGVVAINYRDELRSLLGSMKKFKLGPVEAEMFDREVRETRMLASSMQPNRKMIKVQEPLKVPSLNANGDKSAPEASGEVQSPNNTASLTNDITGFLLDLATDPLHVGSPRLGIGRVWLEVEDALRSFAKRKGIKHDLIFSMLLSELRLSAALRPEEVSLVQRLKDLRESAVNATVGVSEDALINYVIASAEILKMIGVSDNQGLSASIRSVPFGVRIIE